MTNDPAKKGRTHYDVLGITPAAPPEIVTAVYRAWMTVLRAHPDLGGDEEFAKDLNVAYETLKDPSMRTAYDSKIALEVTPEDGVARRAPRRRVDAEIAYCASPEDGWLPARVVDASALGLKVRTKRVLRVGQNLAIAFPGKVGHACEARVKWLKTFDDFRDWRCEAGLEFFSPIPDVMRRLGHGR